jgi:hypothetical protein
MPSALIVFASRLVRGLAFGGLAVFLWAVLFASPTLAVDPSSCPTSGDGVSCFGAQKYCPNTRQCYTPPPPCPTGLNQTYNCTSCKCVCESGHTMCAATGFCRPNRTCPAGLTWDPCTDECTTPFVLRDPPSTQSGGIDLAGDLRTDSDIYLNSGKALRADGAGATNLNLGNWDAAATGFAVNIWGDAAATGTVKASGGAAMGRHPGYDSTYAAWWRDGADYTLLTNGSHTYLNAPSGNIYFRRGNATRMTMTSAGFLGIGDDTPAALFTVGGNDRFQVDASGNVNTGGVMNAGDFCIGANCLSGVGGVSGTANALPRFNAAGSALVDSSVRDAGSGVLVGGGAAESAIGVGDLYVTDLLEADGGIDMSGVMNLRSADSSSGFRVYERPASPGRQMVFEGTGSYSLFNVATDGATTASPRLAGLAMWTVAIGQAANATQFQIQGSPTYGGVIFTQSFGSRAQGSFPISFQTEWPQNTVPTQLVLGINGNVGVNKASPAYRLDVGGSLNAASMCISGDCVSAWPSVGSAVTGTPGSVPRFNAAGDGVEDSIISDDGSGLVIGGNLTAAGDLAVNGGDITTTSGTLNVGATSGTVNLGGGVGSSGCTVDSAGNLGCTEDLLFTAAGAAAPTYGTRSAGTRAVLYPAVAAAAADYALGIEGSALWSSVPTSSQRFRWYAGTSVVAELGGTGSLTAAGDLAVNGGDITSSAGTLNVGATSGTVNIGAAASSVNIGGGSGSSGCTVDASGNFSCSGTVGAGGGVGGSGTVDRIAKFTGASTVGDSVVYETGGRIGLGAVPTTGVRLDVNGNVFVGGEVTATSQTLAGGYGLYALTDGLSNPGGGYFAVYGRSLNSVGTGVVGSGYIGMRAVTTAASGYGLQATASSGSAAAINASSAGTYSYLQTDDQPNAFQGQVRVNGVGNCGAQLCVWDDASPYGYAGFMQTYSGVKYGVWQSGSGYSSYFAGRIGIGTLGSASYMLDVTGDARKSAGGSAWATTSDRRVKRNVEAFNVGLDALRRLRPVSFEYNGLGGTAAGTPGIGLIAQEAAEVAPWMVTKVPEKMRPTDEKPTEIYVLEDSSLPYMNLNAIVELAGELDLAVKLDDAGRLVVDGDVVAPQNRWGGGSGWIACPASGECSCPAGQYVTKTRDRGAAIYCNEL